jgi:ornithine cyclodeaminase
MREAHLGDMPKMSDRIIYHETNPEGAPDSFIILPAWQPQEGLLCKLVTSFPNNRQRYGIANVNSIYAWVDGKTGLTEAVIDGEAMIFRKTSADSALGADILAREDADTLLMIGAGGLAPWLVRAHLCVRPALDTILVWNHRAESARAMVELLASEGIASQQVDDLDAAVERADIISAATRATEPLIRGELLKPGVHVDLVGSFTPEMRESDDAVMQRCDIYVDHRQTTERSGEFLGPFERGVIAPDDVRGDLFELCRHQVPGRHSSQQRTLMKNGGGSYLDYFVARYLMQRVNEKRS